MANRLAERRSTANVPKRMSYEEFREWATEDVRAEWVDGEVFELMPPTAQHQRLLAVIQFVLQYIVASRKLGEVFIAPFEMRLREGLSYREPDLLFVARENLARIGPNRLNGPADLVIEIVSDDSAVRDRRDKFADYQAAGIPEYWLIDPRTGHHQISVYRRSDEGVYESVKKDEDGRFNTLAIPGFWFDPKWLALDPLPDPVELLSMIAPGSIR